MVVLFFLLFFPLAVWAFHIPTRDVSSFFETSDPFPQPSTSALTPIVACCQDAEAVLFLPSNDVSNAQHNPPIDLATEYNAPLLMAYYPDWVGSSFRPELIDFFRYDWIDFAFALPDSEFRLTWDDSQAPALLSSLVDVAHSHGKKVKLSVGGWTGSRFVPSRGSP
jgi:hypothetical protein